MKGEYTHWLRKQLPEVEQRVGVLETKNVSNSLSEAYLVLI